MGEWQSGTPNICFGITISGRTTPQSGSYPKSTSMLPSLPPLFDTFYTKFSITMHREVKSNDIDFGAQKGTPMLPIFIT
jgi:hypothetical protein